MEIPNTVLLAVGSGLLLLSLSYVFWRHFWFFRNPSREIPQRESVISPADGTVVYVKHLEAKEPVISIKKNRKISIRDIVREDLDQSRMLIGVFMSPFDVHYNRAPISGVVDYVHHYPATFKNRHMTSMHWRSLMRRFPIYENSPHILENERTVTKITGSFRDEVMCCHIVQIAGGIYQAVSEDSVVHFTKWEKAMLFKAVLETVPAYRSRIRVFSPRTSLYALYKQYLNGCNGSYPCRGGIDYFFINSQDGNTYPCGYRGNENLGKYWEMDGETLNKNSACYQCDWECFRDPSELFGPLLEGFSSPGSLMRKFVHDLGYLALWIEDARYYHACDLFDGRKPPNLDRLRRFSTRK